MSAPPIQVSPYAADDETAAKTGKADRPHHLFSFPLEQRSAHLIFKLSTFDGHELAQAVVNLKALKDGDFALWAIAADGGVLARRWHSGMEPWHVRTIEQQCFRFLFFFLV